MRSSNITHLINVLKILEDVYLYIYINKSKQNLEIYTHIYER